MTTDSDSQITLFYAPQTRSFRILWFLEELGQPYKIQRVNLWAGEHRQDYFKKINPMGKVPAVRDGDVVIAESGAICTYLADKYPEAEMAPAFDSPLRADYLRWMFFATGCIEPAVTDAMLGRSAPSERVAWGDLGRVADVLRLAVGPDQFLLGNRFSAADVFTGSMLIWSVENGVISESQIKGYVSSLEGRIAYKKALSRETSFAEE